jgi:hypothetical protein
MAALQRITVVQHGRFWVDERGNCGYEGNPTPLVNLMQLAHAARSRSGGGNYHSRALPLVQRFLGSRERSRRSAARPILPPVVDLSFKTVA